MTTRTTRTIKGNDPVREALTKLPLFHDSIGHAFDLVRATIMDWGYCLACDEYKHIVNFHGREGRVLLDLCVVGMDGMECNNWLGFAWHTMETGRIELTATIS